MRFFSRVSRLSRKLLGSYRLDRAHTSIDRLRICRVEEMEPRQYLTADLHLGAVYFEPDNGSDTSPNVFQVTFQGGAPGTQLTHLVINAEKNGVSLAVGDNIFQTAPGSAASYGYSPLTVVSHNGFTVLDISDVNGSSQISLDLSGFVAGDKLEFTIDTDAVDAIDPVTGKLTTDPIVDGFEFQGSQLQASFTAPHYYSASTSAVFYDFFDPAFAALNQSTGTTLDLPPDRYDPTVDLSDRTAGAAAAQPQTPLPSSLSGTVYVDANLNNHLDTGEQGLAGVKLDLMEYNGTQYVDTGMTTVTDANGDYKFDVLPPGTYQVVKTEPLGYFNVGASAGNVNGTTLGMVVSPDIISQVTFLGGENSVQNDFGEALPNSLGGHVLIEQPDNGSGNEVCNDSPGEPSIAGVTIHLLDSSGNVVATTQTDANGVYSFTNLAPGTYGVHEDQPAGYFNGDEHLGNAGGLMSATDYMTQIVLGSDVNALHYNFCEIPPAGISGYVYSDLNNNGIKDSGEQGLTGVAVILKDAHGNPTGATTTTDATGFYQFEGLMPGTYSVADSPVPGYFDGINSAGSAGGTAAHPGDTIVGANLVQGVEAVNYNFGELLPASIGGHVLIEQPGDVVCNDSPGEPSVAGVTIHLLDASGNVVATTQTDANGVYSFSNLAPGTYGVERVPPAGYFDGDEHLGDTGGVMSGADVMSQVALGPGVGALHYNFCELLPASLSGHVLIEQPDNGSGEVCNDSPGSPSIAGVTVHLLDASGNVVATTQTDADGVYSFTNLVPGTYGVHEDQPAGYFNGDEHLGDAGGVMSATDFMTQIALGSGVNAQHYNFCEIPPAEICGFVYSDLNNNGIMDSGEAGIAGVEVKLLDAQGNPTGATTTTDSTGHYCITNLMPGTYGVADSPVPGYYDGLNHAGDAGGTALGDRITGAVLPQGVDAENYDFGELLPASISGHVLIEQNGDCVNAPGETIPGVTIQLLDASGNIIATTQTDSTGTYTFGDLAPGIYSVAEVQPSNYFQADDHVGSAGGTVVNSALLGEIALGPGVNGTDYDFCQSPPAVLSGIVFQDGPPILTLPGETVDVASVRDGVYRAGDPLLAGITLQLVDGVNGEPIYGSTALAGYYDPNSPIQTVTDQNGHYEFDGLAPGNYGVFEVKPKGYLDGINTPGSLGGVAFSPNTTVSPQVLDALAEGVVPDNNAIIRIPIPAGEQSVQNNFSVVKTVTPSPPLFLPPTPPTPPTILPAEFVVLPPPVLPLLPTSPLPYQPNPRYYGSDIVDYTWHLSVIDAGQPRDSELAESTVQLTEVTQEEIVAWQQALGESEWILASRSDDGRGTERHVLFGIKGGIPVTGDFNGDGITDVGVFKDGQWFIDLNGNGVWDEGDLWAKLGERGDLPVTGDWDGDGKTDIGIYGRAWAGDPRAVAEEPGIPDSQNSHTDVHKNIPRPPHKTPLGMRVLKRTVKGNMRADVIDHVFHYGTPGDVPVAGDWNGDGLHTIGIFRDGNWYLDLDGDGKWTEKDGVVHFGQKGDIPIVGDFNGDGITDIGVYRNGTFYLDTNGNHVLDDDDQVIQLGQPGDIPVVGDWDGSGRDQPGVYHDGTGVRAVDSGAVPAPAPSAKR